MDTSMQESITKPDKKLSKELILETLSGIVDPELQINIVDLGLVYDVRLSGDEASGFQIEVDMTLTSIACPIGPTLKAAVQYRCEKLPGVKEVTVNIVFNPPWDVRKHASEDAKLELGII